MSDHHDTKPLSACSGGKVHLSLCVFSILACVFPQVVFSSFIHCFLIFVSIFFLIFVNPTRCRLHRLTHMGLKNK